MRISSLFLLAALSPACGGTVNGGDTGAVNAGPGGGNGGSAGYAGDSGVTDGGSGGDTSRPDAMSDARYHDPGCTPAVKVQGRHECDVFTGQASCGAGAKCAPYVHYAMDCQTEEVGTECVRAGTAAQGDPCANDLCAPGFVCVTAGIGLQCAQLCQNGPVDGCPPGLLCVELDVDGFFVCE